MSQASTPPRENLLLSIALNVIVPSLLLSKGKEWFGLEPSHLLVLAMLFPLGYGIYDLMKRKRWSLFSTIGLISVIITGGIGLFKLSKDIVAWKEAALPAGFALATIVSLFTKKSLVGALLYSPEVFDVEKIDNALRSRGTTSNFNSLLRRCTLILAASFVLSAILNFVLARWLIQSETGTDAFNEEMGKMLIWSWPVIFVPTTAVSAVALVLLVKGIKRHAGLDMEEVMHGAPPKETPPAGGPAS